MVLALGLRCQHIGQICLLKQLNVFLWTSDEIQDDATGFHRPGPKFKIIIDLKIGHISIGTCIDTGNKSCAMDINILDSDPELRRQVDPELRRQVDQVAIFNITFSSHC